jgi:hypothetical protein
VIHQHLPVFNHQEKTRKGCCKCRQKGTSTESATVMLNGISTRFVPYITGISLVSASSTAVNLHLPPQNVGNLYPNGPNPVLTFSTGQLEMSLDTKLWHMMRLRRGDVDPRSLAADEAANPKPKECPGFHIKIDQHSWYGLV